MENKKAYRPGNYRELRETSFCGPIHNQEKRILIKKIKIVINIGDNVF